MTSFPPPRVLCEGLFCASEGYVVLGGCLTSHTALLTTTLRHISPPSFLLRANHQGSFLCFAFPLTKEKTRRELALADSNPEPLGGALLFLGSAGGEHRDEPQILGRQKMLTLHLLQAYLVLCPVQIKCGSSSCSKRHPAAVGRVRKVTRDGTMAAQTFSC